MINNDISLNKKQIKQIQEMAQKLREYINLVGSDDAEKRKLMLMMSVQFFIYALSPSNNRIIGASLDRITELFEEQREMILSTIIGTDGKEN